MVSITEDIVVAGGGNEANQISSLVEIFSPETMSWRNGPDLPTFMYAASIVEYDETLLVSGGLASDYLDTIYQVDN